MKTTTPCESRPGDPACAEMPDLRRLNYFHGQMLGVADFRAEQAYFRAKQQLHNRCLHGSGTVCGLMVVGEPQTAPCESPQDPKRERLQEAIAKYEAELAATADAIQQRLLRSRIEDLKRQLEALPPPDCGPAPTPRVLLECGFALDAAGREIVVPRPHAIDPWHWLSPADRQRVKDAADGIDLYLSICYCEQPIDPTRPLLPEACGSTPDCLHGKVRESYTLRVASEAPPAETCCDPCCSGCGSDCLLLAVLRGFRAGKGATAIDNSVRRVLDTTVYPATTITGISWTHGATYSADEAGDILGAPEGTAGLQVRFSRPVLAATLVPGVVDVWVLEGGRSKRAGVYYLEGEFGDFGGAETVDSFRFRYLGDENLDPGDRIFITVRCGFILDACCRPVDGAHVGGRVPIIDAAEFERFDHSSAPPACALKPPGYGPWTSGAGTPGASFESWFFVESTPPSSKRRGKEGRS